MIVVVVVNLLSSSYELQPEIFEVIIINPDILLPVYIKGLINRSLFMIIVTILFLLLFSIYRRCKIQMSEIETKHEDVLTSFQMPRVKHQVCVF